MCHQLVCNQSQPSCLFDDIIFFSLLKGLLVQQPLEASIICVCVLDVEVRFMTNIFLEWLPTWNGMQLVSSAANAKSSWMKSALASYEKGKSSAKKTMSGTNI